MFAKGDTKAFEIIMEEQIQYLYKVAYMHLKNEQKALDTIQECSYKGFINIGRLNDENNFKGWITRILVNICIDMIRKESKVVYLNDDAPLIVESAGISLEDKMDLYEAIDNLKPEYKTVIILKYFDDLSVKEISKITNVGENTVKARLRRAGEVLSKSLLEAI